MTVFGEGRLEFGTETLKLNVFLMKHLILISCGSWSLPLMFLALRSNET